MQTRLIDKYRPRSIDELILPSYHGLDEAFEYLQAPYPSAWLAHGEPGLGKTSLGQIMIAAATEGCELSSHVISGPDLTIDVVRDLAHTCRHQPMPGFGKFYGVLVDEADSIPRAAQVRLLALLENLQWGVFFFSSNDSIDDFEHRFVSRLKLLPFTSHSLCVPATAWLETIASKEGIPITHKAAERLVKDCRSNLRAALQELDSLGAKARAQVRKAPPMLQHPGVANLLEMAPKDLVN